MKKFISILLYPIYLAITPLYIAPIIIAAGIAAAATVGAGIANYLSNKKTNEENVAAQKEVNAQNLAFQEKQFQEQSFLNRNQHQITASDMQKAGLNPLTMNGVSLTSGNFNSTAQAPNVNPYMIDSSGISNIASAYMQSKTQKDINQDTLSAQKEMAAERNQTDLEIARLQSDTQQNIATQRITEESRQFQLKLSQDMTIANIEAELKRRGIASNESIEAAKRVSEQLKRDDDYQKAMAQIRLEEKKIENAKNHEERQDAINSRNGWLNFASSLFNTVVSSATNYLTHR